MSNESLTPSTLRVIRLALLGGVLLFGSVVWYLTARGTIDPLPAAGMTPLLIAFTGVSLASLFGLAVLRSQQARAEDPLRRATLAIVGWAVGEAPALLGGVIYLLSASPIAYYTGVAILLASFAVIPIPEER